MHTTLFNLVDNHSVFAYWFSTTLLNPVLLYYINVHITQLHWNRTDGKWVARSLLQNCATRLPASWHLVQPLSPCMPLYKLTGESGQRDIGQTTHPGVFLLLVVHWRISAEAHGRIRTEAYRRTRRHKQASHSERRWGTFRSSSERKMRQGSLRIHRRKGLTGWSENHWRPESSLTALTANSELGQLWRRTMGQFSQVSA